MCEARPLGSFAVGALRYLGYHKPDRRHTGVKAPTVMLQALTPSMEARVFPHVELVLGDGDLVPQW